MSLKNDVMTQKEIEELFEYQASSTIKYIMNDNKNMTREEASKAWYRSKTLEYLKKNNMYWVAPSRCYWELQLEYSRDPRWLATSFT